METNGAYEKVLKLEESGFYQIQINEDIIRWHIDQLGKIVEAIYEIR